VLLLVLWTVPVIGATAIQATVWAIMQKPAAFSDKLVPVKGTNLAMVECMRTSDAVGLIELPCFGAQASVGCQRSVFGKPGANRALRNVSVKSSAENALRSVRELPRLNVDIVSSTTRKG
jgi:hypothetical protein